MTTDQADPLAADRILGDAFASRPRPVLIGQEGAVAAAHPLAVAAGQDALFAGGSAIDAMIAAQAVLCVVAPDACGLGGDMLCLIRAPNGDMISVNGAGATPAGLGEAAATGGAAVTVPGIVDAWDRLAAAYGRIPLSRSLAFASRVARGGVPISPALMRSVSAQRTRLEEAGAREAPLLQLGVGQRFVQNELAMLLDRIGKEGRAAFYAGAATEAITKAARRQGGALSPDDFALHRAVVGAPITVPFRGATLCVQPPMAQGVLLAMAARALESNGEIPANRRDHAAIEATEAAFAYRDRVGEGEALLEEPLTLDLDRAAGRGGPRAYLHTAGVSVADKRGLVVSSLVSVFDDFGSGVFVPACGIFLNNRAAGFTAAPNDAQPRKRPVHTLAPAMLTSPHGTLALSTPGADGQIQTLLQIICALFYDRRDLAGAIDLPRWRSENGTLLVECAHPLGAALSALGHRVAPMADGDMRAGAVTAAGYIGGTPIACGDWRRLTWAGVA